MERFARVVRVEWLVVGDERVWCEREMIAAWLDVGFW